MIKLLRRRFILVAMCSTFAVLLVMIGSILIFQYVNITEQENRILNVLIQNDGKFPKELQGNELPRGGEPPGENEPKRTQKQPSEGELLQTPEILTMSPETPFETRFFYAELDEEGEIQELDTENIKAIDDEAAKTYAAAVWEKGKQKRFITDASHELKTPLTIIHANTEVLEMMQGENEWTKSTKNQTRCLASMTRQMVMLTKLDEERPLEQITGFCLSAVIVEEAKGFYPVAEAKGNSIILQLEPNISYRGDEEMIRSLVGLLLDNAVKYSNCSQAIVVNLYKKGKKTVFCVKNGVDSIAQGNLDILFERFYRTDESRNSQTGGSGIGLSIAQSIVQSHKGKITAFYPDGKTIELTVIL